MEEVMEEKKLRFVPDESIVIKVPKEAYEVDDAIEAANIIDTDINEKIGEFIFKKFVYEKKQYCVSRICRNPMQRVLNHHTKKWEWVNSLTAVFKRLT